LAELAASNTDACGIERGLEHVVVFSRWFLVTDEFALPTPGQLGIGCRSVDSQVTILVRNLVGCLSQLLEDLRDLFEVLQSVILVN